MEESPAASEQAELRRYAIKLASLPSFPYECLVPVQVAKPQGVKIFEYVRTLQPSRRAELNTLRAQLVSVLTDSAASTKSKLEAHEAYLQQLPANTGQYVVYEWRGMRSMDVAFERYYLLNNMGWLYLDLGTAAATSGELDSAHKMYAKAAGMWLACEQHGFREGEASWDATTLTATKKYVTALREMSVAMGQTTLLEKVLKKGPAHNPESESKFRRLVRLMSATANRTWAAARSAMSKNKSALGPLECYTRLMEQATRAVTYSAAATSVIYQDSAGAPICEEETSNYYGLALVLYRSARDILTRVNTKDGTMSQLKALYGKNGTSILDKLRRMGDAGNSNSESSESAERVSLRARLGSGEEYVQQLDEFVGTLSGMVFACFNTLEGDVNVIHKVAEVPADRCTAYTEVRTNLPAHFLAAPEPYELPEARPSHDEGANDGDTGGTDTGAGAETNASVEQQMAWKLYHRASNLRALAESRIPAQYREMVVQREQVLRKMIASNTCLDMVIHTLQTETIPFLQEASQ